MLYILHPTPLTPQFTLDEALHWVAYRQYAAYHPIEDLLDDEKCEDIDEIFERKTDKPGTKELFFQENNYERLVLKKRGLAYPQHPEYAATVEERLPQIFQHFEEVEHIKNVCLDPYKSELLLKLQEGKIIAFGKQRGTLKKGVPKSKWKDKNSWQEIEYQSEDFAKDLLNSFKDGKITPIKGFYSIPSEFWHSEGINWRENSARSSMGWFHLIFLPTDQLISLFPDPEGKPIIIEEKAGYLIYDDQKNNLESMQKIESRRGRPQLNWPEFHAEILRYCLSKGTIPELQKDIEHHMEAWCQMHWGFSPSHGAMNEQIRPLYKKTNEVKKSSP